MSSKIFWYSGVSGGGPASSRQLFGLPVRTHCPLKSGYFPKSTTWAADGVASSATASAAAAQIELRERIGISLESGRSAGAAAVPSALLQSSSAVEKATHVGEPGNLSSRSGVRQ